jgi:DNA-binding CsgD family transcriptional regulator
MTRTVQISQPSDQVAQNQVAQSEAAETRANDFVALIDLIGSAHFFDDLADALDTGFGFEAFHIFLYTAHQAPVHLANRPVQCSYPRGLDNYLTYTYVINPVFRGFLGESRSGVYLISDFVPDDFKRIIDAADVDIFVEATEPIGYRTPGWPKNMEECIVLIRLPNGTALDFSFLTQRGGSQTLACQRHLKQMFPVLDRVVQKQYALHPASFVGQVERPGQEDRFQEFGRDVLTEREMQVAQLILVGHGSTSIALLLDVSLSTIKTHRRNIYSKLQISSQAELFSLFLLHLK